MSSEFSKTILKRIDGFPALPATVSKVITITDDAESSAQDLMEALLPDQAMCLTILKIANSAFFGLPREVSTIDKAVMVLGFNEIRNIVLGKAVFNSFKTLYRSHRDLLNGFWEHSFLTGLAAKIIAEDLRLSASESFIGGLIHDIGRLVMLMGLNAEYVPIFEMTTSDHVAANEHERTIFSTSHDETGYFLLKRWLFPKSLLNSTYRHHSPLQAADDTLFPAIIGVANILAHLHQSAGEMEPARLSSIVDSHIPDVKKIWGDYNLDIKDEALVKWREDLRTSSDQDRGILTIITT